MKISDIQVTPIHTERWGNDLDVVNAARVSFHKEALVFEEKDAKLINYLAKHKHFSPFNHSFISVRVKAPIFVARQLVKHKFMPWNEVSRRYVDEEPEFYFPEYWRKKADNVKQGSSEERCEYMYKEQWDGTESEHPYATPSDIISRDINGLLMWYEDIIRNGCSAEQARMILPQNMMTEWRWSGTLGAFCDMLVLRLDKHTQYESRTVAQKIRDLIMPIFPVSLKARLEAAGVE